MAHENQTFEYFRPPRLAEWVLRKLYHSRDADTRPGDFGEIYNNIRSKRGVMAAMFWYWLQVIICISIRQKDNLLRSMAMFNNYLKTAVRNLFKQRLFSLINISGLAGGIAVCIFILVYINYELTYDSHHKDADRIYRVLTTITRPEFTNTYAGIMPPYASKVKGHFPQVENITWLWRDNLDSQVEAGEKLLCEKKDLVAYADDEFFRIFSAEFIHGDPVDALSEPNTVVITSGIAQKYFDYINVIGEILRVDSIDYRITGIIDEMPGNSIFKYRIIRSWNILEDASLPSKRSTGTGGYFQTFAKLHSEAFTEDLAQGVKDIIYKDYKEYFERENTEALITIQPLQSIHLDNRTDIVFDPGGHANILYIYIFSGIAVFILLIASVNFVNLSTARSAGRAGEVGIRKVAGAHRSQLVFQFLGDSFVIVFLSYLMAISLVILFLPEFNSIASTSIKMFDLLSGRIVFLLLVIFLIQGLAAGFYPALVLSSFRPVTVLKGNLTAGKKGGKLRRSLVILQFSVSLILIIVTLIFNLQLNYMKTAHLGFDREQMLIIDLQRNWMNTGKAIKSEFLKDPSILGAAFSTSIPGRWMYPWDVYPAGEKTNNSHKINVMGGDSDFLDLYNIEIASGEKFNETHTAGVWILNEKAVSTFGWKQNEEAVSRIFMDENQRKVIGVSKDFHFTGLQNEIEPFAIFCAPIGMYLSLKVDTQNLNKTLAFVDDTYRSIFPGNYLEYFFLDDDFNEHYRHEEQMGQIFNLFTALGIFIACLGLFGLSVYMAEQKTKEIGIRKVLGATASGITIMLTGKFVVWVVISIIIAIPAGSYIVSRILQNFAYRMDPGILPYAASGTAALLIAALTVSRQSIKAAMANPVDSLKHR